jgi:thiosulfate sulfurtransferase
MFWNRVKQITAEDATSLMQNDNVLLVDVRRPEDYAVSHVKGAILADKNLVHEVVDASFRDQPVICYCYRGYSSRVAVKQLRKAGFTNVLNLKGGYDAWKKNLG